MYYVTIKDKDTGKIIDQKLCCDDEARKTARRLREHYKRMALGYKVSVRRRK